MRNFRLLSWIAIIGATCFAIGACGLFESRTPLTPPPPAQGCRPLRDGPAAALIPNIQDFYGETAGLTCYSSVLDTSFTFHPDGQDSAQTLPDTSFAGWDEVVEGRVNSNIANAQDFMDVTFPREYANPVISPDENYQVRFYEYQVRVSLENAPEIGRYTGLTDLTFHRGADGQWKITDWVDHRGGPSDSTWGILRKQFRIGF